MPALNMVSGLASKLTIQGLFLLHLRLLCLHHQLYSLLEIVKEKSLTNISDHELNTIVSYTDCTVTHRKGAADLGFCC